MTRPSARPSIPFYASSDEDVLDQLKGLKFFELMFQRMLIELQEPQSEERDRRMAELRQQEQELGRQMREYKKTRWVRREEEEETTVRNEETRQ
jgi:hypothetical protein